MTIYHQLAIAAPIERVYLALSTAGGVSTWWDKQTPVETAEGLVLEHYPGAKHGVVRLRVLTQIVNKRIEWVCISEHPPESPVSVWTETHFIFDLSEHDSPAATIERDCDLSGSREKRMTTVNFRQTNYDESSIYAGFNNFAWALVLSNLKRVCESQSS